MVSRLRVSPISVHLCPTRDNPRGEAHIQQRSGAAADHHVLLLAFFYHLFEMIPEAGVTSTMSKRLTENEFIDFSRLWHDGCVKAIIEAQDVDRNHSAKV
jgi:hypothetical protein